MREQEVCFDPTTMAAMERRTTPRHSCYTDLRVNYDGMGQHVDIRAPDISSRGMFINTPQVFPIGAALTLRFRLGHTGRLLTVRADVRYCLEGVGIGVEFTDLTDTQRQWLDEASVPGDDW